MSRPGRMERSRCTLECLKFVQILWLVVFLGHFSCKAILSSFSFSVHVLTKSRHDDEPKYLAKQIVYGKRTVIDANLFFYSLLSYFRLTVFVFLSEENIVLFTTQRKALAKQMLKIS